MTLAARTREAAAEHPFLVDALRAGIVNHAAAARFVDVDGEEDAIATALRRYGEALEPYEPESRSVRVTMRRGIGRIERGAEPAEADTAEPDGSEAKREAEAEDGVLLRVNDGGYGPTDDGDRTALLATGAVDAAFAAAALDRLVLADVAVDALAFDDAALVALVDRRAGADALRAVEAAAESVPTRV